jgi:hypothetical protein
MAVSVEKRNENGSLDWEQLGDVPIIDVKPGKTVLRLSPVDIPLGDYRVINNNSIHVQLRADISDNHTLHIKEATVQVEDE